jgi:diaminohydroxyphosphoribosylaminopyrimidine deaminase / 5-amino-6-(5-phosphoribosylamino)uracil reductase
VPTADETWMRRALELAERGRGHVEPNPLVGAVIVRDGQRVGEGWHQRYGQAHAEVVALAAAGEAARDGTLYVTLEPCCHHGKTPPCTGTVLRAGIARVVAAMPDPFPQVAGKGAEQLQAAGVAVEFGLCEAEARRLNAPYLKLLATGQPYVHAKWAMTLDGKIATRSGDSKWISNEASRRHVHELRGRMDAILVGIGTALADDPQLTARPAGPRVAVRIVFDSRLRLPTSSFLAQTARQTPTLIATTADASTDRAAELEALGCEVLRLPSANGHPSITALLAELGRRRFTNLLVEGGSAVLGGFLDVEAIDEAHVFVAPRLAGGADARTPIGGRGVEKIADALTFPEWCVETIDGDVLLHAWRFPVASASGTSTIGVASAVSRPPA